MFHRHRIKDLNGLEIKYVELNKVEMYYHQTYELIGFVYLVEKKMMLYL